MADKTMPTPGPWTVFNGRNVYPNDDDKTGSRQIADCMPDDHSSISQAEAVTNAWLIAAAGTAASEVADMGYDPIKAIRALPYIMRTFQGISTDYFLQEVVDRAACKEGDDGNR